MHPNMFIILRIVNKLLDFFNSIYAKLIYLNSTNTLVVKIIYIIRVTSKVSII